MSLPITRSCATMNVHRRLLNRDPGYAARRDELENFTIARQRARTALRAAAEIPVVVHVVYGKLAENISTEQVASQLDVLNADFTGHNADIDTVPSQWGPLIGDPEVTFRLADSDPSGAPSDGITRTSTQVLLFTEDDAVKSHATGGADPWPADRYLNLWVCHLDGILGYAQFPGGPAETDGVVVDYRAFGTRGTATPPFDLGRTATHEIGHWLNLHHIWGDDGTGCAGTDAVDDTPNQAGPNTGAPTFPHVSCDNGPTGDMFVNFMDYVDDRVMVMFTKGQVERMQAALDGARPSFGTQPLPQPGDWEDTDLTLSAPGTEAAGDPAVCAAPDGTLAVFYRGTDGHIHELHHRRAG